MDLYITEMATGYRLALSMMPELIKASHGAAFQTYDIINCGEVKIPKGTKLTVFTWSGILPGRSRRKMSFIKSQHWQEPKRIQAIWESWKENGTKLKLMVTGTPINCDVELDNFTAEYSGGHGDITYTITFSEAKDLVVYTVSELNLKSKAATNKTNSRAAPASAASSSKTYTVKPGDSFWRIAEQQLGKGTRYEDVAKVNGMKSTDIIHPGDVLTLPAA